MDENKELTREELEQQQGEQLPPREVMSVIDPDPTQSFLPPDKVAIEIIPIDPQPEPN